MAETCPHLEYREEDEERSFEVARAFCTVTDSFVQPMRADICNARYGLDPATDCEFYVEPDATGDGEGVDGDDGSGDDR
ncbi:MULTISPECIES: hypothetical protein [Haloferacaceae]|uniref:Uncharacterized protein n=1 Tax=Halorubrum glutamatedens TaxID=2707018 RepID=A0ABD5QUC3_9EURY|nr:hypothetical protein [Halobellus captivus]